MGIEKWSTTAGSNNLATPEGWPEGQAPSTVNDCARNMMANIREWYEDAEWLKLGVNGTANGFSISFVSTTVFHFVGTDRRTLVPVNRRVQAGIGSGVIEGRVTVATMSASDTVVTVAWDSGSLDNSLSYVALNVLTTPGATQAQMESASAGHVWVTPDIQHHHPAHPKAHANISMSGGTPSLRAGHGVDSVADTAVGRVTVTLTTSFSTSDYTILHSLHGDANDSPTMHVHTSVAPASFELRLFSAGSSTLTDSYSGVSVTCLGDL